jgi:hypothetical protein
VPHIARIRTPINVLMGSLKDKKMLDTKQLDEQIKMTNKAIASVVSALHLAQKKLSEIKVGSTEDGDLQAELLVETILRGELLVWSRNLSFQMDLSDFETWLKNPIAAAAKAYLVDEQTFIRWTKTVAQDDMGNVKVYCNHPKCRMTKILDFDNPKAMHDAEIHSASEIWYCHHHKNAAWENCGAISDELFAILKRAKLSPGCNKTKLNCKNSDLEFLCLIGLMQLKSTLQGSKTISYKCYLTNAGATYLSKSNN